MDEHTIAPLTPLDALPFLLEPLDVRRGTLKHLKGTCTSCRRSRARRTDHTDRAHLARSHQGTSTSPSRALHARSPEPLRNLEERLDVGALPLRLRRSCTDQARLARLARDAQTFQDVHLPKDEGKAPGTKKHLKSLDEESSSFPRGKPYVFRPFIRHVDVVR